jgi:MSHA biogenesis protein MshO
MAKRARVSKGFTLIELCMVMVLLGMTAMGAGGIIKASSQIFIDVSEREALTSNVRFSVERLNREIRTALPNSVRVFSDETVKCLEYIPTLVIGISLEVPAVPEATDPEGGDTTITVVRFDDSLLSGVVHVVVNPLVVDQVYDTIEKSTIRYALDSEGRGSIGKIIDNLWTIELEEQVYFKENSPTKRIFFVNEPVAYCASEGLLTRYTDYGFNGIELDENGKALTGQLDINDEPLTGVGVLMAESIDLAGTSFTVKKASSFRNTLVDITLQFSKNTEYLTFHNQAQVLNVP